MTGEGLRVLLVDDHAAMRMGFRTILEASDIEVAGEATTGREAVAAVERLDPDVVCMDVQMPDMDGIEATRRILGRSGRAPRILIVTTFDRDDYLFAALDAGASGFLLKNAGPEELVNAVRVVAGGDALLAPEVTRRVIERHARSVTEPVQTEPRPAVPRAEDPPRVDFTEREAEVLRLPAQALSNAEIAQRLFIGEATVKTHVSGSSQSRV